MSAGPGGSSGPGVAAGPCGALGPGGPCRGCVGRAGPAVSPRSPRLGRVSPQPPGPPVGHPGRSGAAPRQRSIPRSGAGPLPPAPPWGRGPLVADPAFPSLPPPRPGSLLILLSPAPTAPAGQSPQPRPCAAGPARSRGVAAPTVTRF